MQKWFRKLVFEVVETLVSEIEEILVSDFILHWNAEMIWKISIQSSRDFSFVYFLNNSFLTSQEVYELQ